MLGTRCFAYALIAAALLMGKLVDAAQITVRPSDRGAIVLIDNELFTEYLTKSGHQPALWPIIGPTGKPVTRSFPVGPLLETEQDDHPHHHSLWFAHQDVNGHDFWLEPQKDMPPEEVKTIRHVDFVRMNSGENKATLVTRNQWVVGDEKVICEDERRLVFGLAGDSRWIDFSIELKAINGPVTFGDIKDGTFSLRLAGTMKVDSGGTLINSHGQKNAKAWGMPAKWIDNYGQLGGKTVGVAMFSHPRNFQHPCRWHVRNYGLLCANPFGDRHFPKTKLRQHSITIPEGKSLTLHYRVFLHLGDTEQGRIAEAYENFSKDHTVLALPTHSCYDSFEPRENREPAMQFWEPTDSKLSESVWSIASTEKEGKTNHYLRVSGKSKYEPPVRSPHSIAWFKELEFGSFVLQAKVQNTNVEAGPHRDLCIFWGQQDPSHFYYVHLGAKPDPHSSQIFIVNGADRKKITSGQSPGIPWTEGWHTVRVRFHADIGLMQVYFDDMQTPVLTATDTTFSKGRVGLGTFDDHGNFDDVFIQGDF